ncbi:MAG: hypothetical protein U5K69_20165 [Balneolaceae bacterium]|nr:hypothetical protein [Balneolaceae bacterium]
MAEGRVGRIDDEFVINPTISELEDSDIDMIVGGTADSVIMMEGEMDEISETEMLEAIKAGHEAIQKLCQFQEELREEFGVPKRKFEAEEVDEELKNRVHELAQSEIQDIVTTGLGKEEYSDRLKAVKDDTVAKLVEENEELAEEEDTIRNICKDIEKEELRGLILNEKRRIDGRSPEDIRDIWTEVGYMARTHGSAIFTRGETQALVSVTLGSKKDEQAVDTLFNEEAKHFYLHYNFPPFSVGETAFLRGPGRREIRPWPFSRACYKEDDALF